MANNEVEIVVTSKDRSGPGLTRAAASAKRWARDVGNDVNTSIGKAGDESRSNFMRKMFTPDPEMVSRFTKPFASAIATPVGAAVAAALAVAISGAIGPLLVAGLGTALLGVGALSLFGGKADRDKARQDLEAAKADVKAAQERAKSGTADAKRNLAEAQRALAQAQKAAAGNKAFDQLDANLTKVGTTLKTVAQQAAMPLLKPFAAALEQIDKAIKSFEPALNRVFKALAPSIQPLVDAFIKLVENALPGLEKAMPGIATAFAALADTLPGLGTGLATFLTLISENQEAIDKVIRAVVYFATGALVVLGKALAGASSFLVQVIHAVQSTIAWFGRMKAGVSNKITEVMTIIKGLPGRIRTALGNLGRLLYQAGRNVVQGLIDGIRSMISAAATAAAGIAGIIRANFPLSPAKEGPLSGQGDPLIAGGKIGQRLAQGIATQRDAVAGAMGSLLGGRPGAARGMAGGTAAGATTSVAAGGPLVLRIESGGSRLDDLLVEVLRKAVRIRGGNVQLVLGQ